MITSGNAHMEIDREMLVRKAFDARKYSYSPYSHFKVGAALISSDGEVFTGCNCENASYTPGSCAERTVFYKAVSEGVRSFDAIAIVGGYDNDKNLDFCSPCGVCRQVMSEFCTGDFEIILAKSEYEYKIYTLDELLPVRFGPEDLENN